MVERVKEWLAEGLEVRIFTARVCEPATANHQRFLIANWCMKHLGVTLPITHEKDYDMEVLFDDRARQVETNTGRIIGGEFV